METFEIGSEDLGSQPDSGRVDKFLALRFQPLFSRSYFAHLLEEGLVLVNGKAIKKRETLKENDVVEICFAEMPEADLTPENIPLDILYEDKDIIVVNKPAGLVIHPAPGNWSGTFVNALLYHCHEVREVGDPIRPGIVHRLDKDTTGVLVAAKHLDAQKRLVECFSQRLVEKEYIAVTVGKPRAGRIETLIGRDHKIRQKMAVVEENGKNAISNITVLKTNHDLSLVAVGIETGRTHQIRVHLKHLKAPVLGDPIYGSISANNKKGAKKPFLHAWKLSFPHPITHKPMSFEAPVPPEYNSLFPDVPVEEEEENFGY